MRIRKPRDIDEWLEWVLVGTVTAAAVIFGVLIFAVVVGLTGSLLGWWA